MNRYFPEQFTSVYTPETAPGVVEQGKVLSIPRMFGEADDPISGTLGLIEGFTRASFEADSRGERITYVGHLRGLGEFASSLSLGISSSNGTVTQVELSANNPSVQVLPGQVITITQGPSKLAAYTCEYTSGD